ncbi:Asp23/Gls24 family envelope stress response protein [Corynebacterium nasicanis]
MRISERAVSRIVAAAADSVPGTTTLGRSLAGRTYPRYDVIVDDLSGTCSVEAFIAVVWPAPLTAVATTVRRTIADWVTDMTGLTVTQVNVVVGPVVPDVPVTASAVAAHPTRPRLRPVSTPPPPRLRPITVRSHRVR